jgi:uncharacterized iron-regulated membrane protein
MKNQKLNQWIWKWHFIAGIISLPFILTLSITGAIYLFNPDIEKEVITKIKTIDNVENKQISYQKQWEIVTKKETKRKPISIVIPTTNLQSTEFVYGKFGNKNSVFVNPNSGEISGKFSPKDTWMHTVRKIHGELLGGKIGTKIIELVASWMVVLIFTGLYVWWPIKNWNLKGLFLIRLKEGKRIFYRDLHAVLGFWISILLLITLAGGLPWTDVFGGNFKWVQKVTNTGYPNSWKGIGLSSKKEGNRISLDKMVTIAKAQNLEGTITIGLPKSPKSTFSISNKSINLANQKMIHFDQYSGKLIKHHNWSDVGFLMRGRMWVMAFHQGEFGAWNWWIMFCLAILLATMSFSAIASYLIRKPKNKLGTPKVSSQFKVGKVIIVLLILLAVILPLFGISVLLILLFDSIKKRKLKSQLSSK